MIQPSNPKNKEILDFVLANSKDEEVKQTAQLAYDKLTKLAVGAPSPVFTNYENANGGTNSLSDFKGKLVYVDVWATWCKPCLQELPAMKALQEEYKGKDITFVSLSVDKDKEAWKAMVTEEKMQGVQLHIDLGAHRDFIENYDLTGIPRFFLISKEGKIISISAPRPSEAKIKELINANL